MYIRQSVSADQTHHSKEQKWKHREEEKRRRDLKAKDQAEKRRRDLKAKDQAEKNYAPVDFVKLVILSCNKD